MKLPELPPVLRRPLPGWLILLLAAFFTISSFWIVLQTVQSSWNKTVQPSWIGVEPGKAKSGERVYDVDTYLIHGGLVQVNTWEETLRWWHGTWVGQVPFYRPITSYVFWFQWKAWGDHEPRYASVSLLFHLAAVLFFTRMAHLLFQHFRIPRPDIGALVTCLVFTRSSLLLELQTEVTTDVFERWKNEPDSLTLVFFSLALTMYLHNLSPSGTVHPLRALWTRTGATVFYLLVCLTKEAGIFLPLLLPLIEAEALWQGGEARRGALGRMAPLFAVLVLYLVLRSLFLGQVVGYQYGTNGAWPYRMATSLLGRVSDAAVHLQWVELSMVGFFLGVWGIVTRLLHRPPMAVGAAVLLLLLMANIGAFQTYQASTATGDRSWDIISGLLVIFEEPTRTHSLACAAILILTFAAFRFRLWFAATTYGWALLALGMTLFSPSVIHRFYLINAGFVLLWIGGGLLLAQYLFHRFPLFSQRSGANVSSAHTPSL